MVATGLATASPRPVTYANLAIRGRLLGPILAEQLAPATALRPQLISINGGNNDIIRPRVSISSIARRLEAAIDSVADSGAHVVLVTVANMTRHLPLGSLIGARGNRLVRMIEQWPARSNVTIVNNWTDDQFDDLRYWAPDKLHLNTAGHRLVAAKVLAALNTPVPALHNEHVPQSLHPGAVAYWNEHVIPWIGRRISGRSSGDGRPPKSATLQLVHPVQRLTPGQDRQSD
jgi:lysophospholipase L1-like esterase